LRATFSKARIIRVLLFNLFNLKCEMNQDNPEPCELAEVVYEKPESGAFEEVIIGENWWDSGKVNPTIVSEISNRIQKELDSGVTRRSMDNLDYTTFGELSVIITANWDIFGSIFNSRKGVERVLANLNTLRGPIAHCSKLSEDEVIRLNLTVRDWFRTMQ